MKSLFLIPARGGSKGVPGKNVKPLNGKPLIFYSVEVAREFASDDDICVSTDDAQIATTLKALNYDVPFLRPKALATDKAGMHEVIIHALDFYAANNKRYETVVLLQPTSPLRTSANLRDALKLYTPGLDMVVSVKQTSANPYFKLYEERPDGYLEKSKQGNFLSRQEVPAVWELNGAIYIYNVASLRKSGPGEFTKLKKYVMSEEDSVDIDTELDWMVAEWFIKNRK